MLCVINLVLRTQQLQQNNRLFWSTWAPKYRIISNPFSLFLYLTHCGHVLQYIIIKICQHYFRDWLIICSAPIHYLHQIDDLMQKRHNPSHNALELCLFCINPWKCLLSWLIVIFTLSSRYLTFQFSSTCHYCCVQWCIQIKGRPCSWSAQAPVPSVTQGCTT